VAAMSQLIYLDNCATSHPKPRAVATAMANTVTNVAGNPGRSFHKASLAATRILFQAREAAAELLGLDHPERLVFTRGATEGLNLAIKGLLKPGEKMAISMLEHNSVIRPAEAMKRQGVTVEHAPCGPDGLPDPARIPAVKALVTTAASNVTGAIADLLPLAQACRAKGVLLVVDAAQAAGSIPMPAAGQASVIAMTGHKGLLGPQGIGLAWFAPGVEPAPLIEGGTGSASESAMAPEFWPDRHEAGTLNTPGAAGLLAAVKYIASRGIEDIREHEVRLCGVLIEALANHRDIIVYPPLDAGRKASLVSFNVRGVDPAQVSTLLGMRGIAVRSGLHCCPQAHRFLGTFPDGAVRASPGPFTTKKQIGLFIKALCQIAADR